jgi:transcriptional regulator with XRE-family HTH domain
MQVTLQTKLEEQGMTMYQLSKRSGVPKTTVLDICSGKSEIGACNARTIQRLSQALGCSMEELMQMTPPAYAPSGLPTNELRFEKGLPMYLRRSIDAMTASWARREAGEKDLHWDMNWCELNADINYAENEQEISPEQAWYLRKKYLHMERE